jgi:hypothetical protein
MGLDSYLKYIDVKDVINDLAYNEDAEIIEFRYWRKHQPLHDWMKRLFIKKGGDYSVNQFNCEEVRVTIEDLEFLKNDMDWIDEMGEDYDHGYSDHEFINDAIDFLKMNPEKAFYFYSWY